MRHKKVGNIFVNYNTFCNNNTEATIFPLESSTDNVKKSKIKSCGLATSK